MLNQHVVSSLYYSHQPNYVHHHCSVPLLSPGSIIIGSNNRNNNFTILLNNMRVVLLIYHTQKEKYVAHNIVLKLTGYQKTKTRTINRYVLIVLNVKKKKFVSNRITEDITQTYMFLVETFFFFERPPSHDYINGC